MVMSSPTVISSFSSSTSFSMAKPPSPNASQKRNDNTSTDSPPPDSLLTRLFFNPLLFASFLFSLLLVDTRNHNSLNYTQGKSEESWFWRAKHRKMARMEIGRALEMRKWVVMGMVITAPAKRDDQLVDLTAVIESYIYTTHLLQDWIGLPPTHLWNLVRVLYENRTTIRTTIYTMTTPATTINGTDISSAVATVNGTTMAYPNSRADGESIDPPPITPLVVRIPYDGTPYECIPVAVVGTGNAPVLVTCVPDLCPYWGVYGWDPRHNARFTIREHVNPVANGTYVVFWSTASHLFVNQHKAGLISGEFLEFRGDVFIAKLTDPESETEETVYTCVSSDVAMADAWNHMLEFATGHGDRWSLYLLGSTCRIELG
ncbi:MAG: hypothetical protein Q9187_006947 [Circinaria calcarea]